MRIRTFGRPASADAPHRDASSVTGADAPMPGRRGFLKLTMAASGCLALGIAPTRARAEAGRTVQPSPPQAFLIIAPDNTVTVAVNRTESGQGVSTALPMALADELDADWRNVRTVLAPAGEPYKDPVTGIQMTAGSTSVNHSFAQYRELGASARAMLVAAAAQRWNVDPATCRTANGVVTSGNYRATYGELAPAAMAMPVPQRVSLKSPDQFRIIGKPTPRIDARGMLDGTLKYGMDWRLPDTMVAVVARPPRFGGKVASYDAAAARAVKGVVEVVEIPTDRGGTGVAVIANGYWPAKLGRDALKITWKDAGSTVTSSEQMQAYKQLAGTPGTVVRTTDAGSAPPAAARIRKDYEFPYLAHAAMEPLSCTVDVGPANCACGIKIWGGSSLQTSDRAAVAKALGVAPEKVQIFTLTSGGDYGRRSTPTSDYVVEAAHVSAAYLAAGHLGPVKTIWTREDDLRGGYYRPMVLHRVDIGVDGSGAVRDWQHVVVGQSVLKGSPLERTTMLKRGTDPNLTEGVANSPYGFPMQVSVHQTDADVPVQTWRSGGNTHTAFVMETLVDELAHSARQDPVAYRMARLAGPEHTAHRQALALAVDKSGYGIRTLPAGHAWGGRDARNGRLGRRVRDGSVDRSATTARASRDGRRVCGAHRQPDRCGSADPGRRAVRSRDDEAGLRDRRRPWRGPQRRVRRLFADTHAGSAAGGCLLRSVGRSADRAERRRRAADRAGGGQRGVRADRRAGACVAVRADAGRGGRARDAGGPRGGGRRGSVRRPAGRRLPVAAQGQAGRVEAQGRSKPRGRRPGAHGAEIPAAETARGHSVYRGSEERHGVT